jgi:hypothetical protein
VILTAAEAEKAGKEKSVALLVNPLTIVTMQKADVGKTKQDVKKNIVKLPEKAVEDLRRIYLKSWGVPLNGYKHHQKRLFPAH